MSIIDSFIDLVTFLDTIEAIFFKKLPLDKVDFLSFDADFPNSNLFNTISHLLLLKLILVLLCYKILKKNHMKR